MKTEGPLDQFAQMVAQVSFNGDSTFWTSSFSVEDVLKVAEAYPDICIEAHSGGYSFDWTEEDT